MNAYSRIRDEAQAPTEPLLSWPVVVGVILNSALYLLAIFCAGLFTGNGFAWRSAIAAMGITYLSYLAQLSRAHRMVIIAAVLISIIFGALAGLSLLTF